MSKVRVDLNPEVPRGPDGRHARSPAAERGLQLAREYLAARRALWAAGGASFRARLRLAAPKSTFGCGGDSPEAFEAAALAVDRGFAVSRQVPGVERELRAAIRARNLLVEAAIPLAERYITRRGHAADRDARGLRLRADREDALQRCAELLCHAADLFDPERGTTWSTYATWWIRLAVQLEELASGPAVRLPAGALASWREAERVRARVAAETGESLTWAEICAKLGRPASHVSVLEGVERALRADPADRADDDQPREVDGFAGTGTAERCLALAGVSDLADPAPSPEDALARAEVLGAVAALIEGAAEAERLALRGLGGDGPGTSLEGLARAAGVPRAQGAVIRRRAVDGARDKLRRVA